MENLNINTGDEIEELYDDFLSVLKESVYYITNYGRAKLDIQDKEKKLGIMNEVAYKDSLTGAGNKAGWKKELELLYEAINDNSAAFAIVMFDINNLKYVNDTFGHEQGDNYIINCSNMIRDIYSHSPMFRLGGDEFVVLLKGEDYADRNELLEIIKRSFINTYEQEDKKPYERYSASMGMAEYTESDNDPEQVLRRADEAMYCYKTEFKKKYGSYR
jgi:diguanylate cyclase (GGDEF)-like protein